MKTNVRFCLLCLRHVRVGVSQWQQLAAAARGEGERGGALSPALKSQCVQHPADTRARTHAGKIKEKGKEGVRGVEEERGAGATRSPSSPPPPPLTPQRPRTGEEGTHTYPGGEARCSCGCATSPRPAPCEQTLGGVREEERGGSRSHAAAYRAPSVTANGGGEGGHLRPLPDDGRS